MFELGLGTGHFASMLMDLGITVKGIQPQDEMLVVLKKTHPEIEIVSECKLEEYEFTERHQHIISHSSVFLFTRHVVPFGPSGETLTSYMFQSFIRDGDEVLACLQKTLRALSPHGRLFINTQANPSPYVSVCNGDETLTFEMTRCNYSLESRYVEKTFRLTYKGMVYEVSDVRFCDTYRRFAQWVTEFGFKSSISSDERWIIIETHQ